MTFFRLTTATMFFTVSLVTAMIVPAHAASPAAGVTGPCAAAPAPTSAKNLRGVTLPPYMSFLPGFMTIEGAEYFTWDEQSFTPGGDKPDVSRRGKRWHFYGELPTGCADRTQAWAATQASFTKGGWQLVKQTSSSDWTLHYANADIDAWTNIDIREPRVEMQIIEVVPLPVHMTLVKPAARPETVIASKGDFPYLAPLPGSRLKGGSHNPSPMIVGRPSPQPDDVVAPGSITKSYGSPTQITNIEFITVYHEALLKAGWTIDQERNSADAQIIAHYGEDGRNLWAILHINNDGYSFTVGDENNLETALDRDCHVALTGVLFDFNKSTLKPESFPVLQRVLPLLSKRPALKLEVQGHTDNVGGDEYNQTLSEARATSVVSWLTQHGATTDRLSSKGYGKTMPVADNRTDEGRAQNRRVEISNLACTKRATAPTRH